MIHYHARGGAFECMAPANWKAVEGDGVTAPLVQFFSPDQASISVSRYPDGVDSILTIEDYLRSFERAGDAFQSRKMTVGGRSLTYVRRQFSRRVPHRLDTALIPHRGGFFEVTLAAPVATSELTVPVFNDLVGTFRSVPTMRSE